MGRAGPLAAAALCVGLGGRPALGQECPIILPMEPWARPADASADATPQIQSPSPPMEVAAIRFVGNRAVGDARLRRRMATKEDRPWRPARASRYEAARWAEDHRRLCAVLRDEGYVTARVGPAEITDAGGEVRADAPRRVVLTIPVQEGRRYGMGQLAFEGLSVVTEEEACALFDVAPRETYAHAPVDEGLQALRRLYAARGYAEWTATVVLKPDAARGVVDVLVRVQEGAPRFVGRIAFTGHRGTLDQTLRREVLLDEGDLLDTERLRASIERIETLGYVAVRGVRLTPSARAPQALDVWFEVEPRPVVRYGLVGGVNGLEGASLTGVLGTVNFLGRGERVFASAQFGEDVTALDLAGSRPYAFGTPWTLGFQVQKERLDVDAVGGRPSYTGDEWAVRAQAQRALGGRATVGAGYALSTVRLEAHEVEMQPAGFGRRRESELSSTVRFDGWDHPWKPLRGLRATGSAQWAAGTVDYAKARARSFALAPLAHRLALGLGAAAGWLGAIGSGQVLPFDERFLLGGETDLRGFDVRSVGPRDGSGALIGGTRYLVLQGEAHVDVTRWLRAVAFVDAGQAWNAGLSPRVRDLRVSTGAEARFAMPVFRLPVRLIYAKNLARDELHPRSGFHIAIGPLP